MMSQRSKHELAETIWPRYLKANRAQKVQILNEFVAATGYHRKYAIRLLKHGPRPKGRKKTGRKRSIKARWSVRSSRSGKSVGESAQNG